MTMSWTITDNEPYLTPLICHPSVREW